MTLIITPFRALTAHAFRVRPAPAQLEPKRSKKCLGGVSQFEYNKAKGAIEVAEADAAAAN